MADDPIDLYRRNIDAISRETDHSMRLLSEAEHSLSQAKLRDAERQIEAALRDAERQKELEHAGNLAAIKSGRKITPIVWNGTARQFGDWVLDSYKKGRIRAKSRMDALKQYCEHFVSKDGKPLKARSIWQSLQNR